MKSITILLGVGLVSLLAGCSSTPVALSPVGPNPVGYESHAFGGELQVFSRLIGHSEGNNPSWFQHAGYSIYYPDGKLLKQVDNTTGHYASSPRRVMLPAGKYLVKAQTNDRLWVEVPVMIESGYTTQIHLDGNWKLPTDASRQELVGLPNGNPVGWLAGTTEATGFGSGAAR